MKSLSLIKPGKFGFIETPTPQLQQGQTLVKVLSCGVCGSDIHAMSGKQPFFNYPRILGHELCVEVIEAHAQDHIKVGDRCVIEPYYFCGECVACRKGKTNCCNKLSVLGVHFDGGHTSVISVPTEYLHKANALTIEQAALVEPLAIGCHAVNRANVQPGEPVVILGMGTIGLAAAFFVKAQGATPVIVDIDEGRLNFAEKTLNLGTALKAQDNIEKALIEHFGELPACVIDATGNQFSMNNCFNIVEYGGRIVYIGLFPGDTTFDAERFHQREITLLASRAALSCDFKTVIDAIANKVFDPTPMISERLSFAELDQQLPKLVGKAGLIKAIIDY